MKALATRCLTLTTMMAGVTVLVAGCSSSSSPAGGSGGKTGAGGAGVSTGGGTPGSGGARTGGSPGAGGASSGTGGSGTAGSGGPGGSGPTDGGVVAASFAYTFDSAAQGFVLNAFVPSPPQTNLAAPDSGSSPVLSQDGTAGNPTPGSLKLSATFTGYSQLVDVVIGLQPALNLAGKTIHAKVRLNSGTFANGAGATLHAGTGAMFAYGGGAYTSLTAGTWTDLTLDLTKVATPSFDPTMVVQIGIQFYSGDPVAGGTFAGPSDVVFQIDTITDGTTAAPTGVAYDFDIAAQGFMYNTYLPATQTNLASPDSGSTPTLVFDATEGNPAPGSLKASVTFSNYRQLVDVVLGPSPPLNLMGKTLHAKVRLTSGTFANGAGAILHASTGAAYVYGAGTYTPLVLGAWTDLTLDLATVTALLYDPTMVVQIGIQFYSGDPGEAGSFVGPNDVVFHIDTITE